MGKWKSNNSDLLTVCKRLRKLRLKSRKRMLRINRRHNGKLLNDFFGNNRSGVPHPLVVIDEARYQMYKDNTVLLSNMKRSGIKTSNTCDGGVTSFSIIKCGKYVRQFMDPTFTKNDSSEVIDIVDVKYGYLFFMCRTSEFCLMNDANILYVGESNLSKDYVILMLSVPKISDFVYTNDMPIWNNTRDLNALKKFKKSTVKGKDGMHHYGSTGLCYSFGSKNGFSIDEITLSSIVKYAGDESICAQHFKHFIHQNLLRTFQSIDCILPGLSRRLNISIESMRHISTRTLLCRDVSMNEELSNRHNPFIVSSSINVDCRTRDFHCEKDVTYTTIMVPLQDNMMNHIMARIKINDHVSFRIKCHQKSCFIYSAYCMTHRQLDTIGEKCMNLSSYSNKRLYCSFRRSYERIMFNNC